MCGRTVRNCIVSLRSQFENPAYRLANNRSRLTWFHCLLVTPEQQELLRQHDERQKQLFIEAAERGENMKKATQRIVRETREEWMKLLKPSPDEHEES